MTDEENIVEERNTEERDTEERDTEEVVTLGVADYRISSFDPEIRGVAVIQSALEGGTEVSEKHIAAVEKAAGKRGVRLKKL